jgi:hypothetical protein
MLMIWWTVLPAVFGNTVAVSPISLNILGDLIPITCTTQMIEQDVEKITTDLETKVKELQATGIGARGDQVIALANEAKELSASKNYLGARDKILEAYNILNSGLEEKVTERVPRCAAENEVLLWAWYAVASIAFSGIVIRITKTGTDMGI